MNKIQKQIHEEALTDGVTIIHLKPYLSYHTEVPHGICITGRYGNTLWKGSIDYLKEQVKKREYSVKGEFNYKGKPRG